MKILKTYAICVLLIVCSLHSNSQSSNQKSLPFTEPDYNKEKLFADLPEKVDIKMTDFDFLFNLSVGNKISFLITNGFQLQGIIVSVSDNSDPFVKSVVINSTNRKGASFTISRTIDEKGLSHYNGRFFSRNNGDAFIISIENGKYILQKKNLYDLIGD